MARQANDGRGRLGGRSVGTKNKPKPAVNEWVDVVLNKRRSAIETAATCGDTSVLSALLVVSALNRVTEALRTSTVASDTVEPVEDLTV